MILILSAKQAAMDSPVDPRFGRCQFLHIVDTEKGTRETFANPAVGQSGGAGVAAAQFAIDHKAQAVVSGDFGPNASRALHTAGIVMYLYSENSATVSQALDQFKQGNLAVFTPQG